MIDVDHTNVDDAIRETGEFARVDDRVVDTVRRLIHELEGHAPAHAYHSVRVGNTFVRAANYLNSLDNFEFVTSMRLPCAKVVSLNTERGADGKYFGLNVAFEGIVHDHGKLDVPEYVVNSAPGDWSDEKMQLMRAHPLAGYMRLRETDLRSAPFLALTHHLGEEPPYPETLPDEFYELNGSGNRILTHSRLLSIADHSDATRRKNAKFAGRFDFGKREQRIQYMHEKEPDQIAVVDVLYEAGILY